MSTDAPGADSTQHDIASILEELEMNWPDSDSGPEPDEGTSATISIRSTPKPGLRPYFNSTTSSREKLPSATQNGSDESRESAESQEGVYDSMIFSAGGRGRGMRLHDFFGGEGEEGRGLGLKFQVSIAKNRGAGAKI